MQREIGRFVTAGLSAALLVALAAAVPLRYWPWAAPVWLTGTAALAWLAHRWPAIEYRHTAYRVDALGMEIRAGVFWRSVTNVPRARVQHTDVAQGPFERRHGLGRLVIYTAGTEHSRVELPGLEYGVALQIRDQLLPREGGDAV